jgi:hypothetical protein
LTDVPADDRENAERLIDICPSPQYSRALPVVIVMHKAEKVENLLPLSWLGFAVRSSRVSRQRLGELRRLVRCSAKEGRGRNQAHQRGDCGEPEQ